MSFPSVQAIRQTLFSMKHPLLLNHCSTIVKIVEPKYLASQNFSGILRHQLHLMVHNIHLTIVFQVGVDDVVNELAICI